MAKSKKASKVRKRKDFDLGSLRRQLAPGLHTTRAYSWTLDEIMSARDDQIAGRFARPVRLATSLRTNGALYTAWRNRLAPQVALGVALEGGRGAAASEAPALFGSDGIGLTPATRKELHSTLANHGFAIGVNDWQPREDGSRVDVYHRPWPLDGVWWDEVKGALQTWVLDDRGQRTQEQINHGDGRWTIYAGASSYPWQQDAALLSASLLWPANALALRDFSKGSASHGNAKVVGELGENVDLQIFDEDGNASMSEQAAEFLLLLQDIASQDCPVGIKPAGSKIDYLTNASRAWEVWVQLSMVSEKGIARVYLGTDGTLGSQGGAPGVDVAQLFGVATTIVQSDLTILSTGYQTGTIEPWGAINHGNSSTVPRHRYLMPDADLERTRDDTAKNEAAYCKAIQDRRAAGFAVTQEWADELADRMGVERLELAGQQTVETAEAPPALRRIAG